MQQSRLKSPRHVERSVAKSKHLILMGINPDEITCDELAMLGLLPQSPPVGGFFPAGRQALYFVSVRMTIMFDF